MRDYIEHSDMTIGLNANLAPDRFGKAQSALYLNDGFCTVPPGVYFNGSPFTITAWVKEAQFVTYGRFLDFGNGYSHENVVLAIANPNPNPFLIISNAGAYSPEIDASLFLSLGAWTHLAAVFDGSNGLVYVNGTPGVSRATAAPDNVVRQNCYFGRSNWLSNGDKDVQAYFDDIKIYNRALSHTEILRDMN
jgi:hypothetical protein